MPGPRAELLLQADTLSAGPVGAEPDAEHVIERIICRPVREHPGISGKFIKQAVRGSVALADRGGRETGGMASPGSSSVFAGFRFPREVIAVAVRWYLRYGLSYRDVEELLAERGVTVDHVTIYRWVQRFTPEFIEAARFCRHAPGDRCQAGSVAGVTASTSPCRRRGISRDRAESHSRPSGWQRTRLIWRCSTAFWCRSTRSPASLDASPRASTIRSPGRRRTSRQATGKITQR